MVNDEVLLSVVVPVFNEAPTVGNVIERLKAVLRNLGFSYEIIVVDDCSEDTSVSISKRYGVRVYSLGEHMGKGYALRMGFSKAKGEIIAMIDSDGSHLPEELPFLLAPILQNQADLVIGSRFLDEKPVSSRALNKAGVRLFNALVNMFTGIEVSDSQSGYRVLKSEVLKSLNLKSVEYEIESEMLVKAVQKHFRVREVPISFEQRTYGKSRLDPVADGFKIFLSIVLAYVKG
jgi:glycosyltransferase involved in cell wall biosynthesis